jgi:hypothetical protein
MHRAYLRFGRRRRIEQPPPRRSTLVRAGAACLQARAYTIAFMAAA